MNKEDFVLVEYTTKIKETSKIIDTTDEDLADKEHLFREGIIYGPKLLILGEGINKVLEDELMKLTDTKQTIIEIPPEKAYGIRQPNMLKKFPLRYLLKHAIIPKVGMKVEVDGRQAIVRTVGSGRVILDFNNEYASKTIVYEISSIKKLSITNEKILALIHRRFTTVEENKFKFSIRNNILTIDLPEQAYYLDGIQIMKRSIAMEIQKYISTIKGVKYTEYFEFVKEKSKEEVNKE
jgi:peptidylprolyl isomerase